MTSSRRVELSRLAQRDVRDILQYTLETWDEQQRDIYAEALTEGMQRIADFPEIGRTIAALRPDQRGLRVKQHLIIYRVDGETVIVLRIAHYRKDLSILTIEE